MTHRSQTRKRPDAGAMPRTDAGQKDTPVLKGSEFTALLERATQEILVVTYWFDPAPSAGPYPVTIRFSGRRTNGKKRLSARDHFVHDETIERVVPGSGPISLTARVRDINPGEWLVTAQVQKSAQLVQGAKIQANVTHITSSSQFSLTRIWYRWAPPVKADEPTKTCLLPFAHVPGILPGIWAAMVFVGMVVALTIQSLVISRDHLALGPVWTISLLSIAVGSIGAKAWYLFLYRSLVGWCIQGFVVASTLTAAILLLALGVPAGIFLDATAPGLLFGMAIGRIGCFFAGCCGGPPTASHFGMWSSDQHVGARRVPTQLMESGLAGILGLVVLIAILTHGPAGGAFFAAALATYTLVRQGILRLRAEPRKMKWWSVITEALMALALIAAIVMLVREPSSPSPLP